MSQNLGVYPQGIVCAAEVLGSPYLLGAKWAPLTPPSSLRGPVDCSGFSRWVLAWDSIYIPDGSYNQIGVCTKLPDDQQSNPPAYSLGFFQSPGSSQVDHVVISTGTGVVIEARGEPYNCVILRPVDVWLNQKGFLGFYAPPKAQP